MNPPESDLDNRLRVGDQVVTADDLAEGDIAYFERVGLDRVVVRAMTDEVLRQYSGPIFAVIGFDAKGVAQFQEVSREDVE